MIKDLSKYIMRRSMLRNKYLNNDENRKLYTKQRNRCFSQLRKTKNPYYENLDEDKVSESKLFENSKTSLSEKFNARKRKSLGENDSIENANMISLIDNIFRYSDFDPIIENVKGPTLKDIAKYKKQPKILVIRNKCNRNSIFSFQEVSFKLLITKTSRLKLNKAS